MNSKALIIGVIAVIVLGAFIYGGNKNNNKEVEGVQTQATDLVQEERGSSQESKSQSMGEVEVELTPVKLDPGQNMVFGFSLNTHSVNLSYDFTEAITAEDDKGNTYKTLSWSGGEGGHHLKGEIEMEKLSSGAQKIIVKVKEIDNQKATFEWEL